jgi:phenylalanine-4-hydroxylase
MRESAPPFVPAHLRRFVVEQDYGQYSAIDQAVWRFVLLQLEAQLAEGAHASYRTGLEATGISVDRIPRIPEMNARLARFGWGAVCVDGFVPPRVFQEFQAAGILPIAGDIRSRQHLPYTPAPDIIHEAAGHAPILPDPVFAGYLRRLGALGAEAFTLPEEGAVFDAIHLLSEIKERPGVPAETIARAETCLRAALAAVPEVSEAARLSRLYWWTAEYGLVGTPEDFKLYGAGLLSSLGESHGCRAAAVLKVPLDAGCLDVPYDITRPQPQLYVARSFEHLHRVLDDVEHRLRRDRATALARALRSRELATVTFSSGGAAIGVLAELGGAAEPGREAAGARGPAWLRFEGRFAFTHPLGTWRAGQEDRQKDEDEDEDEDDDRDQPGRDASPLIFTGPLSDGRWLEELGTEEALDGHRVGGAGRRHRFDFASGVWVEGRLERRRLRTDGRLGGLDLADVRIGLPGRGERVRQRSCVWAAGEILTARAGASDPLFHLDLGRDPADGGAGGGGEPSVPRVPRARELPAKERELMLLYGQAEVAARKLRGGELVEALTVLREEGRREHPDDWLLRWNLLEAVLARTDASGATARALERALVADLEALELAFAGEQPIATGLRYLNRKG